MNRASPIQRLDFPALLCTLYSLAALACVRSGTELTLLGFVAFGCVGGAMTTRLQVQAVGAIRMIWHYISALFALLVVGSWFVFDLPSGRALVFICLFMFLRAWMVPRVLLDYIQIWLLSTMMLYAAALELSGIWGIMIILGWAVSTLQMLNLLATVRSQAADPYQVAPRSLRSALIQLPAFLAIAAAIMVVSPRVRPAAVGNILSQPAPSAIARTGLTDRVDFSAPGVLTPDSSVAFRVIDPPATMLPQVARFRVQTFDSFDGVSWSATPMVGEVMDADRGTVRVIGGQPPADVRLDRYEIRLDGHRLIHPPIPRRAVSLGRLPSDLRATRFDDLTVRFDSPRPPSSWTILAVSDPPNVAHDPPANVHLGVPVQLAESATLLGERIFADGVPTDPGVAGRVAASWFRRYGEYSLDSSQRRPGVDGLNDFLAGDLKGHCEFFATALVLVLRQQGIPARLVTGYRGGEYMPSVVGGSGRPDLVITNEHAHAWAECWSPGEGWAELEPTPVNSAGVAAPPPTAGQQIVTSVAELQKLGQFVEGYDQRRQQALIASAREEARRRLMHWEGGAVLRAGHRFAANAREPRFLVLLFSLVLVNALGWWIASRVGRQRLERAFPILRPVPHGANPLLGALEKRLHRRGISHQLGEGSDVAAFIVRGVAALGGDRATADQLADLYLCWRFGALSPAEAHEARRQFQDTLARLA